MARLRVLVVLLVSVAWAGAAPAGATAADTQEPNSVTLETAVNGNHAWAYLDEHITSLFGDRSARHLSTHRAPYGTGSSCGKWSQWRLRRVNGATGARLYGIYLYDGCTIDDATYYPPGATSCNNDDSLRPMGRYSVCVSLPPRTLPAGMTPQTCNAWAVVAASLKADVAPATYDRTKATPLTVTTSFGPQFIDRLSEGFCTDVVDWQVLGWTIRWPDGAEETVPGTGQQGATATHVLAAAPDTGAASRPVVAIAHLHIHGQALDFDNAGQLVPVTRDAFVDVSNDAAAVGVGAEPLYTPPQLQVGAVPVSQMGDGSMPGMPAAAVPSPHAVAIRGRLLDLYPRAIVVKPGIMSVAGISVGQATTTTTTWTYLGGPTDAPVGEATPPGATGTALDAVQVQYNHAERLDPRGAGVDEAVPVQITAHTVYPDGHAEDVTVSQSIGVSIYYPALSSPA